MTKFRQHRGNADGIRQELQKKQGLMVSLRTVERAVQPWRQQLDAEARATVRFETAPGQQLQIDFGASPGGWRIWKRRNELCAELGRRSSRFPLRNALLMALEDYLEPAQIIVLRGRRC